MGARGVPGGELALYAPLLAQGALLRHGRGEYRLTSTRLTPGGCDPLLAQIQTLVVAGGVASNTYVRETLSSIAADAGLQLVCPPARLCTDNGVMVAWAGIER